MQSQTVTNSDSLAQARQTLHQGLKQAIAACQALTTADQATNAHLNLLWQQMQATQEALEEYATALKQPHQANATVGMSVPIAQPLEASTATPLPKIVTDCQQLFEASMEAMAWLENGVFIDCNQAAINLMGYTNKAELLVVHPSVLSPEIQPDGKSSLAKADAIMALVMQQGSHRFEWVHQRADGEPFWVEVLLTATESDGRQLIHATWRDISDRKAADAALQQKEYQYRSIFESINDGIFIHDLSTGEVLSVNPATCKMHGYTYEEFIQLSPSDYIHPDSFPIFAQFIETVQAGRQFMTEAIDLHKDGTHIHVEVIGVPFEYDGRACVLAVVRDISDRKAAEAALHEQTQFLRSTYEGVEHSITIIDVTPDGDFRFVDWNPVTTSLTGIARSKIIGKTPEELLGDVYGAEVRQNYQRCLDAGVAITYEEYLPLEGHDHWWLTTLNPLKDNQGRVHRIILTTFEITDRKLTEAALQQQESQYRSIFESINDGIFIHDLSTGQMLSVNPAVCKMYGYTYDEFIQLSPADYVHPDFLPRFAQFVETLQAGQRFTGEAIDLHREGTHIHVEVTGVPFEYDGKPCALTVVRDISDRKTFEEAQSRLTAILDTTSDLVGISNMEGEQLYLNSAGYRMLELPLNLEVLGRPLGHHHPDWAKSIVMNEGIPAAIRDGIWQGETALLTWEAEREFPVSQVIIAHKDANGEVEYLSTIIRDITAQKQAETALQQKAKELEQALEELQRTQLQMIQSEKMSSLGQLVAGVAHEINNPVNFIHGNITPLTEYTQDLLDLVELYQVTYPTPCPDIEAKIEDIDLDFLKVDSPKLLTSMKVGTERIRQIVSSLKNFSRLDEAECKEADIHEGIDSTLLILEHRIKATPERPRIQIEKAYGDLPPVKCYPGQLNQVFMNILANALDALEDRDRERPLEAIKQNPSTIKIQTQRIGANRVAICITDNGMGIPERIRQQIFDPFFTTKPIGKGTGIGMSISHQIITEKHGGTLHCQSSASGGAQFIIEIPC